jgi:aryl-alcohol dehydrogenase-like predicted oxidoreductase
MEHRRLGSTDMSVSVLGFGGSEIGFQGATPQTVTTLLNAALDAGLNVIDTAECYPGSEELIGNAVSHRRKDFWLFTKVGHEHGLSQPEDYTMASIARSIDRSLARLRMDHVDLVQLHSPGLEVLEKGEAIEALRRAKAAGKTRFVGYSGDNAPALWAVRSGAFDTLQTSVSVADQWAIEHSLPLAIQRGMGVIAKRPIANGAWRDEQEPTRAYHHEYWKRLKALDYPFLRAWNASGREAGHTALRFTLGLADGEGNSLVHTAIVGTANASRWGENAAALKGGLMPKAEIDQIRARWRSLPASSGWTGQT